MLSCNKYFLLNCIFNINLQKIYKNTNAKRVIMAIDKTSI